MKKYGIMGGTFNPIHLAHLYIAYEAKERLNLDKIIFLPTGAPPHKKDESIIDSKSRYEMVEKAIEGYEDFVIDDYEIKKLGYSYTYETLKHFNEEGVEIYFIAGGDSLMDVEKWRNTKEVLTECNFVVFNRGKFTKEILLEQKYKLDSKYGCNIIVLDVLDMDISSSVIREKLRNGKRVDFFLPKDIINYIDKNDLYKGE